VPRNRDARDTDEISSDDDVADDRDVHAQLRREQRRTDAKVRRLEEWRVVVDGLPGHRGTLAQLEHRIAELEADGEKDRATMRAETAKLADKLASQDRVIDKLDRAYWKILVAGSTTGAIVAVVLNALKVFQ
jgi:hypothetical protein